MKIALDLDEVIADFLDSLLKFYHKRKGKLHKKEEFTEYKWWPVWGVSLEEAIRITDEFHETHKIDEIKPVEFAIESLNQLINNNDELFIITARPVRFKRRVEEWLVHYLKTDKVKVFHSGDFHKGQASNKSQICSEMNIKLILEDSGETAIECANNGIFVLLFDKPWNKKYSHQKIIRVKNWLEALEEIKSIRNILNSN